jgi:hypothetical protein
MKDILPILPYERQALAAFQERFGDGEIYKQQIETLVCTRRENTGVGCYSHFSVPATVPRLASSSAILTGLNGEASGIEHGVGFILFIKDGRIDCLEGFTYGETWPDDMVLNKVYLDSAREK